MNPQPRAGRLPNVNPRPRPGHSPDADPRPARTTGPRLLTRLAVLAVCGAALLSCGTAKPDGTAGQSATASSDTTTAPTDAEPGTPATSTPAEPPAESAPPATSSAEVEVERDGMEPALVTGVRSARHDGFDRVVIDFEDAVPGYTVRWRSKVEEEGSGKPVDLRGGRALHIMLTPANAHTDDGASTWKEPSVAGSLSAITGIVKTGDFEGRVGIALTSDRSRNFQVQEYTGPDRLVIDVRH
ncbi:AMIN-like domain-containing (lipo)protein [Nonomuraea sp. LPB2021202275-12-8]|uniref:AMIN-like domain-containing (lipo)protein n=1 Tax=Nonomuraea sp. LPB2021202275-12-8 TaxID=3120159 RepID=UPI00300D4B4C